MSHWKKRLRASGAHLTISLMVAMLAALLVFGLWYPYPYRDISGGRDLFLLMMTVDGIVGPLVTFFIFNTRKPRRELLLDLAVIGAIQIGALTYGLWTVFTARPVYLVFEYSRFNIVHAVDVDEAQLALAPEGLRKLPLKGPGLVALRPFKDAAEQFNATLAALDGSPLFVRTDLWQPYGQSRAEVLRESKPVAELIARFPQHQEALLQAVAETGRPTEELRYLPLVSRKNAWTILLNAADAQPLAFVAMDSF